jgi:preprotein translocase subunit SecB
MADQTKTPDGEDAASAARPGATRPSEEEAPLVINAQYIKDLSFEVPRAPAVLNEIQNSGPDISIGVNVGAEPLADNRFEVVLQVNAECKVGGQTGFVLELVYGGLFTLRIPQEHLQPVLLIECPRLLFPFARNIIADVTRDGGFPPLMLAPIDFIAMYQNQAARQQASARPTAAEPEGTGGGRA